MYYLCDIREVCMFLPIDGYTDGFDSFGACVSICQLLLALSVDNHPAAQFHHNYLETWETAGCSEIATAENTFKNCQLIPACFGCHTGVLINKTFQMWLFEDANIEIDYRFGQFYTL